MNCFPEPVKKSTTGANCFPEPVKKSTTGADCFPEPKKTPTLAPGGPEEKGVKDAKARLEQAEKEAKEAKDALANMEKSFGTSAAAQPATAETQTNSVASTGVQENATTGRRRGDRTIYAGKYIESQVINGPVVYNF